MTKNKDDNQSEFIPHFTTEPTMQTNQPTQAVGQEVQETFLGYFRKHKGVYSQDDVEKIVEEAILAERRRVVELVETLRLAKEAHHKSADSQHCYACAYDEAIDDVIKALDV